MDPYFFEINTDPSAPLAASPGGSVRLRVPAEFEPQDAILFGCSALVQDAPQVFVSLVRAAWDKVRLIALVDSENRETLCRMLLATAGLPQDAIGYARIPASSMWARDYGPTVVVDEQETGRFLDFDRRHLSPPNVHDATAQLARLLGAPRVPVDMCLAGGNLLSNGEGLCLTTAQIILHNSGLAAEAGMTTPESLRQRGVNEIGTEMSRVLGMQNWSYVNPLPGEKTGHIDMICCFVSADTLVVGKADPQRAPQYAERLDRIADHLGSASTPRGRLRIVRVPMPSSEDKHSRSYTNVVFANGTLLVPMYSGSDLHLDRVALDIYRQLLPGWNVVGIDVSAFSHLDGALHCLTCNIPSAARIPGIAGFGRTGNQHGHSRF